LHTQLLLEQVVLLQQLVTAPMDQIQSFQPLHLPVVVVVVERQDLMDHLVVRVAAVLLRLLLVVQAIHQAHHHHKEQVEEMAETINQAVVAAVVAAEQVDQRDLFQLQISTAETAVMEQLIVIPAAR
jgi:hydrogenase-4 membrane subunit HyfE